MHDDPRRRPRTLRWTLRAALVGTTAVVGLLCTVTVTAVLAQTLASNLRVDDDWAKVEAAAPSASGAIPVALQQPLKGLSATLLGRVEDAAHTAGQPQHTLGVAARNVAAAVAALGTPTPATIAESPAVWAALDPAAAVLAGTPRTWFLGTARVGGALHPLSFAAAADGRNMDLLVGNASDGSDNAAAVGAAYAGRRSDGVWTSSRAPDLSVFGARVAALPAAAAALTAAADASSDAEWAVFSNGTVRALRRQTVAAGVVPDYQVAPDSDLRAALADIATVAFPARCDRDASCDSFAGVVGPGGLHLAAAFDGGGRSLDHTAGIPAAVAQALLNGTVYSVGAAFQDLGGGRAAVASRTVITTLRVVAAIGETQALLPATRYAKEARDRLSDRRHAAIGVGAVCLVLIVGVTVAACLRGWALVAAVVSPLSAITANFEHAAKLELAAVTRFVDPAEEEMAVLDQSQRSATAAMQGQPTAPFSRFEALAVVEETSNAMARALMQWRKAIPKSLISQMEAGGRPVNAASSRRQSLKGALASHTSLRRTSLRRTSAAGATPVVEPPGVHESPSAGTIAEAEDASDGGLMDFRFGDEGPDEHSARGALDFGLRRVHGAVMVATFAGFLKLSQDFSVHDAHMVSQVFLNTVVAIVERHGGVVLHLAADRASAVWGAFTNAAKNEARAAACAFDLQAALRAADEAIWMSDLQWAAVVTAGPLVVGNSGTATDRATVVQGPAMDLAAELPALLVSIGVQVAVSDAVKERLPLARDPHTPWCALPVDVVSDEGEATTLFELRPTAEPRYAKAYRHAFASLVDDRPAEARRVLQRVVDSLEVSGADEQVQRLYKLAGLFQTLQSPYIRAVPSWQRFDFDRVQDTAHGDSSPRRRYWSEKRKSAFADDVLRNELLHLRTDSKDPPPSSPSAPSALRSPRHRHSSSIRRSIAMAQDPAQGPARREGDDAPRPSFVAQRRRSSRRPFPQGPVPSLAAPPEPPAATAGPPLLSGVQEFRDRKKMLFRMSRHVLGKGASGEVVLGITETGTLVAVKSVPVPKAQPQAAKLNDIQRRRLKRKGVATTDASSIKQDMEQLLQEVAVLSRLRDEHIVGYLSSAIVGDGTRLVVVMEYISGGSLANLLQEFDAVPLRTAKRYLRDVLKGLQFLHSEGIIHRDLKPHNVLMLIDGSCKLTDFGTSASLNKLAGATDVQGTPQYMAPEACRGQTPTKASDIWGFGVLMAELLTGELPWPEDGQYVPIRFMYQVGNVETMVPRLPDALPEEAAAVIMRCCRRDPAERPTADELLQDPFFAAARAGVRRKDGNSPMPESTVADPVPLEPPSS